MESLRRPAEEPAPAGNYVPEFLRRNRGWEREGRGWPRHRSTDLDRVEADLGRLRGEVLVVRRVEDELEELLRLARRGSQRHELERPPALVLVRRRARSEDAVGDGSAAPRRGGNGSRRQLP